MDRRKITKSGWAYWMIKFPRRILGSGIFTFLSHFREVILILAFYIPNLFSVFSSPQLFISYEIMDLFTPLATTGALDRLERLQSNENKQDVQKLSTFIYSPQLFRLDIHSNVNREITNFGLKVNGVRELNDVSITSDSAKITNLRDFWTPTLSGNYELSFPSLETIPPQSTTTILVWGVFTESFVNPQIEINSSADNVLISKIGKATDFALFISDNQVALVGLLLVFFVWLGIKRTGKTVK